PSANNGEAVPFENMGERPLVVRGHVVFALLVAAGEKSQDVREPKGVGARDKQFPVICEHCSYGLKSLAYVVDVLDDVAEHHDLERLFPSEGVARGLD